MYPLKFEKILKEKIWGGDSFYKVLEFECDLTKKYGESWEVSCNKNGESVISNGELKGKKLEDVIILYKEKLLGKDCFKRFNGKFPVLIKFLDINDKLSVQVHPNDEYAEKNESDSGKTEGWYIIKSSKDSKLIAGVKNGTKKSEIIEKINNKNYDFFNIVHPENGEFLFIAPGTVHATVGGSLLIYEVQQNSDTTYRLYDFDRLENGEKRELHIKKALDVIDVNIKSELVSKFDTIKKEKADILNLCSNNYFITNLIKTDGNFSEKNINFAVYSCIDGKFELTGEFETVEIKKGETVLVPALLEVEFRGIGEIIKSTV